MDKKVIHIEKHYGPDIKKIQAEIKKLKIPKEYWGIDLNTFFNYQWNIYMSIRETAGKTTQALLFGLVLSKLYPDKYCIEYLRNDLDQIRRADIANLFNTVVKFGYISKIFEGVWNDVIYKPQLRSFYLIKREGDEIVSTDVEPICVIHAIENAYNMKSSYNNPRGNYIVVDEFPDTKRSTYQIFPQLLNMVSTIGRPMSAGRTEWLHILMLGNNTDEYCFYFDDFQIAEQIPYLTFGGSITFKTEYNTTGICKLLELSDTQKERLKLKNIPFLGFSGKKAAPFTGESEWGGEQYKHLTFDLDYTQCVFRRAYIRHRGRYIQFDLFNNEKIGKFLFLHFANEPKLDDNIIFTLDPEAKKEVYGLGKYEKRQRILNYCKLIVGLYQENRVYYASNKVGSLVADYIKNIK